MSSGMIKIDDVVFMSAHNALNTAVGAFDPAAGPEAEISSKAAALEHFRAEFMAFGEVMALYRELLSRDASVLLKGRSNLTEKDRFLSLFTVQPGQ